MKFSVLENETQERERERESLAVGMEKRKYDKIENLKDWHCRRSVELLEVYEVIEV